MAWFMGRLEIVKDLGIFPLQDWMLDAIFLADQPNPSLILQLLTSGPVAVFLSSKPLLSKASWIYKRA